MRDGWYRHIGTNRFGELPNDSLIGGRFYIRKQDERWFQLLEAPGKKLKIGHENSWWLNHESFTAFIEDHSEFNDELTVLLKDDET